MWTNSKATQILKFLYLQNRKVKSKELSKVIDVKSSQVYSHLKFLLAMGIITTSGEKDYHYYYYIPKTKRGKVKYILERIEIEYERRNELNRE